MKRVLVVQERLPHYRMPFFAGLRERLQDADVQLDLAFGEADRDAGRQGLPWATPIANRAVGRGTRAPVWQPAYGLAEASDLVVVEQASRLLLTYALLARQATHGTPVALWGHGANLKADLPPLARWGEVAKRGWSRAPHWWFAYTDGTADRIAGLGFPRARITVVQNSMLTSGPGDVTTRRDPFHCVFVGSLYAQKGLNLLIDAADRIAWNEPRFSLTVVGDGALSDVVAGLAASRPHLTYAGPLYGGALGTELARASLMLVPGAVGLAVVEAFAGGLPLVTTAARSHGPEVEYLRPGVNGLMTPAGDATAYADAVLDLLRDPSRLAVMRAGALRSGETYTLDAMADRFAAGVLSALGRPALVGAGSA